MAKETLNGILRSQKFKIWHSIKIQEVLTGKSIEDKIDDMMCPQNLKVEAKENGKWVPYCEDDLNRGVMCLLQED